MKRRVLHIIPDLGTAGAEMVLRDLLLFHNRGQFEVAVCSLFRRQETIIEKELEESNINVVYLNKRMGPDLRVLIDLYKVFRSYKPDIIHTHRYVLRYVLLPSLLCRIQAKIHTVHSIAKKEVDAPGKIIHRVAFKIFKVQPVGISREVSRTVQELYGLKDVPFIYNGVRLEKYSDDPHRRQKFRRLLNISDNQFIIIHIGRFSPPKNHKLLITAFSLVASQLPHVRLLLVGEGELRSEMEALVDAKGIADKVQFLGVKKEIPELLSASDLFCLSSDWEGFGLVVLESMASGKPVVATAVGGVPELIIDGVNGLLVKRDDLKSFSAAMLKVIRDPRLAQEMGKRGQQIARDRFDICLTVKQYEKLYTESLKKYGKLC